MTPDEQDERDLLDSGLFDSAWYVATYGDVAGSRVDPLAHFLWLGASLGRSPGPAFDAAAYLRANPEVARSDLDAVRHFLRHGRHEGRATYSVAPQPAPAVPYRAPALRRDGGRADRPGRPTLLLCGHIAGKYLFGGERSFLDMLAGLDALGYNVVVTLPDAGNRAYYDRVHALTRAIWIVPCGWWRADEPVDEAAVGDFSTVIAQEGVGLVFVNTIVLREPLVAARRMEVRSMAMVRELIRHDDHLLDMIGLSPDSIVRALWASVDQLVANSGATRDGFVLGDRAPLLLYNTTDLDPLAALPGPAATGPVRVGLISSNIPKKGIGDFIALAEAFAADGSEATFHLIGPENEHTADIARRKAGGDVPANLHLAGYRETPVEAVRDIDVIVNLSHFRESFGRTVLEGMAAGRPPIVYDHGAPPEFVRDGMTGFLASPGDVGRVAEILRAFVADRGLLTAIGAAGKADVQARFGRHAYVAQMRAACEGLLAAAPKSSTPITLPARRLPERTAREDMRIAYFSWHFPVPSETFVLNELQNLKERGYDVRVFCRQSPHPEFRPDFEIEWERVEDAEHLARRLTETGRTIVHSHFVYPTVTEMVWPACEAARVPFTFIAHAQDIFRHANDARNRIGEVALSDMCRKVFVPSEFHRRYLAARGVPHGRMMLNPNGCAHALYAGGRHDGRAARPFRRVVAIHRFTEKKGLIHLIGAARLLEAEGIRFELWGYGELEDEYRQAIARDGITNVTLCGPVKGREAMLEIFRGADLFACPSVRAADGDMDGIPTVLMEAMAAGLPVLTTDLSGIPDLVEDGITGFVCAAEAEAIAARIRAFYAMPDAAIGAVIQTASDRILENYDTGRLTENLLWVWAGETLDLMIVTWNNPDETSEVIRRLYKFTSLPFHLIVCDNGSAPEAVARLIRTHDERDNMTLVLNRENALVGPGTNICLAHGHSDLAVYVCGKEGMTTRYGWDLPLAGYMSRNPDVGLAGTLCHSPSYLHGRDYPMGQPLFHRFRNPEFARTNPDRTFRHVQGGFFVVRRSMVDAIGGFSDEVPHDSTDVEFSYYVESEGWRLGEVPGLMSLYNKTRPGLFHRIDERAGALHPPTLDDLAALDAIAAAQVCHCNACGRQSARFLDPDGRAICPSCGASRRARSLHRMLAESLLLYRRRMAFGVNVPAALADFWHGQFQGRTSGADAFWDDLRRNGRTDFAADRLLVVLFNDVLSGDPAGGEAVNAAALGEAARILRAGGTLIVAGLSADVLDPKVLAEFGLVADGTARYTSKVSHYDWLPVQTFTRVRP